MLLSLITTIALQVETAGRVEQVDSAAVAAILDWEYPQPPVTPINELEQLCTDVLGGQHPIAPGIRVEVLLRRAHLRVALRRGDAAAADYDAVLTSDPTNISARAARAFLRLQTGDRPELMEREGKELVRKYPDAPEGYYLLGTYYLASQQYRPALECVNQVIARDANNRSVYFTRATALHKLGDHAAAVLDLEKYATLPPRIAEGNSSARVDGARGVILSHVGRYHEAFAFLSTSFREEPHDKGLALALLKVATHLRKFGSAAQITEQLVETFPGEPRAKCIHALSIAQFGQCDEALELLDEAEGQATSVAVHERPRVLAAARRYTEAAEAYEASLAAHPKWPDSSVRYALLLATCPDEGVRNPAKACEHAKNAAASLADTLYEPEARIVQAVALASASDKDAAVRELDAALKLDWMDDSTRAFCKSLRQRIAGGAWSVENLNDPDTSHFEIPVGLTVDTWPPPADELE